MLIIRNAQLEVFREYAFERYEEKLVNYLWRQLVEARTIPKEELASVGCISEAPYTLLFDCGCWWMTANALSTLH
jgi:hypothetical protein